MLTIAYYRVSSIRTKTMKVLTKEQARQCLQQARNAESAKVEAILQWVKEWGPRFWENNSAGDNMYDYTVIKRNMDMIGYESYSQNFNPDQAKNAISQNKRYYIFSQLLEHEYNQKFDYVLGFKNMLFVKNIKKVVDVCATKKSGMTRESLVRFLNFLFVDESGIDETGKPFSTTCLANDSMLSTDDFIKYVDLFLDRKKVDKKKTTISFDNPLTPHNVFNCLLSSLDWASMVKLSTIITDADKAYKASLPTVEAVEAVEQG